VDAAGVGVAVLSPVHAAKSDISSMVQSSSDNLALSFFIMLLLLSFL
jgi:hypothetical protein